MCELLVIIHEPIGGSLDRHEGGGGVNSPNDIAPMAY